MSEKSNYKLRTVCLVNAIHPHNPQRIGTVWKPESFEGKQEADALVNVGYAELTNDAVNVAGVAAEVVDHEAEERAATISAFLARDAKDVIADIEALADEQKALLPELLAAEQAGKGRKTVVEAINDASE